MATGSLTPTESLPSGLPVGSPPIRTELENQGNVRLGDNAPEIVFTAKATFQEAALIASGCAARPRGMIKTAILAQSGRGCHFNRGLSFLCGVPPGVPLRYLSNHATDRVSSSSWSSRFMNPRPSSG